MGHIRLGGVGEGVQTGVGQHGGRGLGQQDRVQHRSIRSERVVDKRIFDALCRVGEDGKGGHFRAGAGGGGHAPEGNTAQLRRGKMADAFGGVHGGAAAEGHNGLRLEGLQDGDSLGHHIQRWIGHHLVKPLAFRSAGQSVLEPLGQRRRSQKGVGYNEDPLSGQSM